MLEALVFGVIASSGLVIGGAIGAYRPLPDLALRLLLAFGSGALISALAFELFQDAVERGGHIYAGLGLLAGAAVFIGVDTWLEKRRAAEETGWALLAAATLDGIPENLALGIALVAGGSPALLVAIFAANVPEAVVGAAELRKGERSPRSVVALWTAVAVLVAAATVVGRVALAGAGGETIALVLSFAGGAVLAALVDTIMPGAFKKGHPEIAFATVAGFFLSYVVASL